MRCLLKKLRIFARDRRGAISILTALSGMVLVGFMAGAVDVGSVYLKTRQLQGITDLAALAAASDIDHADAASAATIATNGWAAPVASQVIVGSYSPDASVAAADRFRTDNTSSNAVRVTLTSKADLYFASLFVGRSSLSISRTATAARAQLASFSLGTRLASLNGGVANALLSALTGSSVNLSVMDYNALASAQVDLFQYVKALRTRADLSSASFDGTLNDDVSTSDALAAVEDVLSDSGAHQAVSPMRALVQAAGRTPVSLANLVDLGPYGGQDYANAGGSSGAMVDALSLASAILQIAQGGRQVQLSLNLGVPGVASASAWLAIGQRPANSPWIAITDKNTVIVRTAQARLYLDVQTAPTSAVAGVASVDVPVVVELASAQAKLSSISCGANNAVTLSVAPGLGSVKLGAINVYDLDNFQEPLPVTTANLIETPLLKVTGSSEVDAGGNDWQDVSFDSGDIANGTVKTVRTTDIASTGFSSLLGNLQLNVQLLGLNLSLGQGGVTAALRSTLSGIATPLDSVINNLTGLLGVGLGEADVRVNGVRCNAVALVQ